MANVREWRKRWKRQAELLRSLDHPALVRVREFFEGPPPHRAGESHSTERTLYLSMNWENGVSLQSWVHSRPRQDLVRGLRFLEPVAEGIDYLHRGDHTGLPVIHRDIKPANILITGPVVRLVDFGLARLHGDSFLTFGGTPNYLAPETFNGQFSPASDRYALGATAFYVITGEAPGRDDAERSAALRQAPVPHPEDLADVVLEMLDEDPRARPESATDWARTLIRLASPGTTTIADRSPAQHAPRRTGNEAQETLPEQGNSDLTQVDRGDAHTSAVPSARIPPTRGPGTGTVPQSPPAWKSPPIEFVEPPIAGSTTVSGNPTVADESQPTKVGPPSPVRRSKRKPALPVGVGAVCVLVLLSIVLVATNRGGGSTPTTTTSNPTTSTTAPTTTTSRPAVAFPALGPLPAGSYSSSKFKPPVLFQVGDGWTSKGESSDLLEVGRVDQLNRQISVVRVQRVYRPEKFNADPNGANSEATALKAVDRAPEDLARWLQSLPSTARSEIRDVTVGNLRGREVDVSLAGVNYDSCAAQCLLLFQLEPSPPDNSTRAFIRFRGQKVRFQIFDVGAAKVVVTLSAPAGEFDDFMNQVSAAGFAIRTFGNGGGLASVSVTGPSGPVKAAQSSTLVAEVKGGCASTQTGTLVSFYDGAIRDSKLYGSAPLKSDGRASLDVPMIRPLDRPDVGVVVAQWAGTSDCEKSTSPPLLVPISP